MIAIDGEQEAIDRLARRWSATGRRGSRREVARFEDATLAARATSSTRASRCRSARPTAFDELWERIVDSIRPGGRFAGQLFGDHDEWAGTGIASRPAPRSSELLRPFEIERLEEFDEDGSTVIGKTKHWHLFHVVARKR